MCWRVSICTEDVAIGSLYIVCLYSHLFHRDHAQKLDYYGGLEGPAQFCISERRLDVLPALRPALWALSRCR